MKSDGDGHAPFWGPVPALVAGLLVVDLLFAIAFVLVEAAGRTFMSLFDLDSDASLPTWYSSIKLFLIASLVGLYALSRFDRGRPRSWILLAFPIVFLLMSADEVVMVHEQIGRKLDVLLPSGAREKSWFRASGIWMIVIGLPFLFGFLCLLWLSLPYFEQTRSALAKLGIGMLLLLLGALGVETLSNIPERHSWGMVLQVLVEEACEMLGATIMVWGGIELAAEASAGAPATGLLRATRRD